MSGEMKYNYIAIEGNIGAGKTSLAKMIAADYNARLILERFADNSFLPKFYKDPDKYAFPLEMSFLADRYQQLKDELSRSDMFRSFIIADYFIDKSLIFARKTLQNDEYALYSRLFGIINSALPKPDLIIYLYNNVRQLKQNILNRGRDYEREIEFSYLEKIQSGYLEYFKTMKGFRIIIVETVNLDFVGIESDYAKLKNLLNSDYNEGIHTITF
jgi:deoxyadenosine/deoxycytidine kinase